jgi:hypothetical protein
LHFDPRRLPLALRSGTQAEATVLAVSSFICSPSECSNRFDNYL